MVSQSEGADRDDHVFEWRDESPVDFVPQRVISLVPSLTESLFDLDLGDRLIARTAYCTRPADHVGRLPQVGGTKNPDIAQIVALAPDLVLLNDEENRREDAEALAEAGIPLWVTGPHTVFDTLNMLWELMRVFDHPQMIPRVREIERAFDYCAAAARNTAPVRVFVPIWRDPWMTFNRDTYPHDLLRVCGAENVFADRQRQFPLEADLGQADPWPDDDPRVVKRDRRYPRIMVAEIEAAQPDLILLPDEPYAFGPVDVEALQALDIPAVRNDRIIPIDGSLLTWHGTRVGYALRDLPPLLAGLS